MCLPGTEAELAANTPSMIRKLTDDEFNRLFRHGYEVADYTLYAYYPPPFKFFGYTQSRWMLAGSAAPVMSQSKPMQAET